MANKSKIKIEETNLEDLIILGEDRLIDIEVEYPSEMGRQKAKAKIKQLTMKEVKNIDVKNVTLETNINILTKSLYKQDETPFERKLILNMPVGVVNVIAEKILEISGVDTDLKKY